MGKTLELRPADVNHLIYKEFDGTAAGKTAAVRARNRPAAGWA